MTSTGRAELRFHPGRAPHSRTALRLRRLVARLMLFSCVCLALSPLVSAQNVQHPQNTADQALKSDLRVDPSTLGLSMTIPLASYPGRAGLSLPVAFQYSSKGLWRMDYAGYYQEGACCAPSFTANPQGLPADNNYTYVTVSYNPDLTAGWRQGFQPPSFVEGSGEFYNSDGDPCAECDLNQRFFVQRVRVRMPDGSTHELRRSDAVYVNSTLPQDLGTYVAVDGSRLRYVEGQNSTGTLYLPDGSRFLMGAQTNKYIDRNGNTLTYNSDGTWTDTLGRTVGLVPANSPATPTSDRVYTLTGFGGAARAYTFRYRYLADALTTPGQSVLLAGDMDTFGPGTYGPSLFHSAGGTRVTAPAQFNPVVLTEVELPDGNKYRFSYNQYGEMDKVVLPTGGYERYQYDVIAGLDPANEPYAQTNRGVTDRWVSPSGAGGDELHWHYSVATSAEYVVTMTYPDNTYTERRLQRGRGPGVVDFGFDDSRAGMAYDERAYSAAGQMLRRRLTEWSQSGQQSGGSLSATATRDPRMTKEVEILLDTGGGSALAATTTYAYDADLNPTVTTHYDYAQLDPTQAQTIAISSVPSGTPLRAEETTYLVNDANIAQATRDSYRALDLIALPTITRVHQGGANGQVFSEAHLSYDETSLSATPNIYNWADPGTTYRGNLTTTSRWLNTSGSSVVTTRAGYDQAGNAVSATDALGHTATVSFNDSFTVPGAVPQGYATYAYPTGTTSAVPDPSGSSGSSSALTTLTKYDYSSGAAVSVTDPNGQTTTSEYGATDFEGHSNLLQRLTKVTRPDGGTTTYAYGDTPSTGAIPSLYVHTKTDEDSSQKVEAYQYFDGLGRPLRAAAFTGDAQTPWVLTDTQYDRMGRVSQVSNPYAAANTNSSINPSGVWTTTAYDALGRALTVTTSDNAVVTTAYVGNAVTVTDQQGKVRRSVSDALGRLIRVDEPDANNNLGSADAPVQPTSYSYDALDNLRKVNQGGQLRYFMYDMLGRLVRAENPEQMLNSALALTDTYQAPDDSAPNSQWTIGYTYDDDGNLKSRTDARGVTTNYGYDALNRVTSRGYGNDPSQTPTVTYKYEGVGVSGGVANAKGQLTSVGSSVSTTTHDVFDVMGHVKQSTQTTGGQAYVMQYGYDLAGHMTSETYPSGRVLTTSYDVAGRVSAVAGQKTGESNKTYAGNFSYTPYGAVASVQLGNGLWEHTTFNSRLQPTQIGLGTSATDSSTLKLDYTYGLVVNGTLDATKNNGNVQGQTITAPGGVAFVQSYTYDELNRLKSAGEAVGGSPDWNQTYSYDRFGNRSAQLDPTTNLPVDTVGNPVIDPANNRIKGTVAGQENYHYDEAGNLTRTLAKDRPYHDLAYDAENHQIKADGGAASGGADYGYDGDGRRVKKVVGAVTTVFVYDAAGRMVAEYSNDQPQANGTSYLTQDTLGSTRAVTGQDQVVKVRHDYFPFGEEIPGDGSWRTAGRGYGAADGVRQKFTKKERDSETGLDYFLARYYSSAQGRFTSPDEFAGGPIDISVLGSGHPDKQALPYADIFEPQSLNKYQYCLNNPLRFIDPNGHQDEGSKSITERIKEATQEILRSLYNVFMSEAHPEQAHQEGEPEPEVPAIGPEITRMSDDQIRAQVMQMVAKGVDKYLDVLELADLTGGAVHALHSYAKGDKSGVAWGLGGMVLGVAGDGAFSITFREAKSLVGGWGAGTFETVAKSVRYHFAEHGAEVGAKNVWQYLRKAEAFARNLRGASRTQLENGATRFVKNGKYVIKDSNGKIISYGLER